MSDEVNKQLVDQSLHILMCMASVNVLAAPLVRFGAVPVLYAGIVGILLTCTWVGLREFFQYPPREIRPWDVWLDATFEIIGIVGGALLFYYVVGPALGS